MSNILLIGLTAFLCAFIGKLVGMSIAAVSSGLSRKFHGCLTGFTGGVLISFVCFEILEEGFSNAPLIFCIFGLLSGVFAAAYLEGVVNRFSTEKTAGLKSAIIIATSVMLHNIPEGIALGAMCRTSLSFGIPFAAIIMLHCIPEGIAIFLPLVKAGISSIKMLIFAIIICLPMALGGILGVLLTEISGYFLSFSLTFSAGVMLYICCGEILPDAKSIWSGRLTTIFALLGFILGVVFTV